MTQQSILVYRNLEHEELTRSQLATTQRVLQSLLDEWLRLDIGGVEDINDLLLTPEAVYKSAIDKLVEVPAGGKFAVKKEAHLSSLELPDPAPLYGLAKSIRQRPFTTEPGLWLVEGSEVIMNEAVAHSYIDAGSVYASGDAAIRLAEDIMKFCELTNSINERVKGDLLPTTPWVYNAFRGKFILTSKMNEAMQTISPDIDNLRRWLAAQVL